MTARQRTVIRIWAAAAVLNGLAISGAAPGTPAQPETVLVTLRARPGAEGALEQVLARHWATARALNLVLKDPHLTIRASDAGDKTRFVEIFTWRDAAIPDAAPAPIRAIWSQMNDLVEARDGRPGLEFQAVSVIPPPSAAAR